MKRAANARPGGILLLGFRDAAHHPLGNVDDLAGKVLDKLDALGLRDKPLDFDPYKR